MAYDTTLIESIALGFNDINEYRSLAKIFPMELDNLPFERTLLSKEERRNTKTIVFFKQPLYWTYLLNDVGEGEVLNQRVVSKKRLYEEYTTLSGRPKSRGWILNSAKEGIWVYFSNSGKVIKELYYTKGEITGPATFWYENGTKASEGMFEDGRKIGEWISYHQNGTENGRKTFNRLSVYQ
jgi:antitoxin component YwqK of YwqJK toxin-antitoxin module